MVGLKKKTLVVLCMFGMLASLVGTMAATQFLQTIQWNFIEENKSFTVSGETSLNYGDIIGPTVKTEVYTVTNTGNVPLTVNSQTIIVGSASAVWDKASAVIGVGESTIFTLTLSITGAGSCTVKFEVATS